MVARSSGPGRTARRIAEGVFAWWRRTLDGLAHSSIGVARTAPALTAGVIAIVAGSIGAGIVAGLDSGPAAGTRVGAGIPLWAGVRLLVLLTVARHTSRIDRDPVVAAWAWSLIPFAAALTVPLHALAFVASALITWRALEVRAATRPEAIRLVAWAYGFQLAVLVAAWLTRNLLLAGRIVLLD